MAQDKKNYFVTSQGITEDSEYFAWLNDIKCRYRKISSRIALQSNYGALEFNWLLGRDIVRKNAIARWGDGVIKQLSLDLRNAFPDVKGFSERNLYYMKEWYEFYCVGSGKMGILHQLGAKLQEVENQNPIKLHQLGAEIVLSERTHQIIEEGGMLPLFGIVPWKHHVYILISRLPHRLGSLRKDIQ